ncbi:MAG: hypothetical protein NC243_11290 [Lachnoclostridium sp.]|nr:hypothetical protein [Lachnoclostridium sp.]MCM1385112.1 hypothetical protein [Lachnoclostridium sp.]
MKESIEMKLEEHGKKILGKEELSMDDVNFLVYLLNRLECKEAQKISKENEEKIKAEQEANNKAWREHMFGMLENLGGGN